MTEKEFEKILGAPPPESWRNCDKDVYSYIDRTEVKLHIAINALERIERNTIDRADEICAREALLKIAKLQPTAHQASDVKK